MLRPVCLRALQVERRIESLLYRRDMSAAYALIAETTQRHWEAGRTEHVAQLLKLASSGLFASALQVRRVVQKLGAPGDHVDNGNSA